MTPDEHYRMAEKLVMRAEADEALLLRSVVGGRASGNVANTTSAMITLTVDIAQVHATLATLGMRQDG